MFRRQSIDGHGGVALEIGVARAAEVDAEEGEAGVDVDEAGLARMQAEGELAQDFIGRGERVGGLGGVAAEDEEIVGVADGAEPAAKEGGVELVEVEVAEEGGDDGPHGNAVGAAGERDPGIEQGADGAIGDEVVDEAAEEGTVETAEAIDDVGVEDPDVPPAAQAVDVGDGMLDAAAGAVAEAAGGEAGLAEWGDGVEDGALQHAIADDGDGERADLGLRLELDAEERAGAVAARADVAGEGGQVGVEIAFEEGDGDAVTAGDAVVGPDLPPGAAEGDGRQEAIEER